MQCLVEAILGRPIRLDFMEDNEATIRILATGRTPALRHMGRTHKVSLAWLYEQFSRDAVRLIYCPSEQQSADIFTKTFDTADMWEALLPLILHFKAQKSTEKIGKAWAPRAPITPRLKNAKGKIKEKDKDQEEDVGVN